MEQWEQAIQKTVNTPVPREMEDLIKRTLHQLPRKKRKASMYAALPAAVITVIALFGITAISPAFAQTMREIPVVGHIFDKVGHIGERKASRQGLASLLGRQVVIDGESVTFTEILYDGSGIHIGFIKRSDSLDFTNHLQVSIDGERLTDYSSGTSGRTLENGDFAGIFTIEAHQDIPDSFALGLSSADGESWSVELPVKSQGDQQVYLMNETRQWRDKTMIYDKIGFYPTSTVLSLRWLLDKESDGYSVIHYQIFDDQGRVLQPFGDGAQGRPTENGQYLVSSQFTYEPVDALPKSLTIKPYLGSGSATGTATQPWEGEGFELSQGAAGSIKIEKVEQEDRNFTITYEVEGELTSQRTSRVWIENQFGQRYEPIQQPHRIEGTVRQYQATFAAKNANDDVIIGTEQFQPIDYLEDLAITFEINK